EENQLRDLATIDALTRVANRGELVRRASIEVSRAIREEKPLGVLIADIDHFKQVNDRLGHAVGDRVLSGGAAELGLRVRETDFIGRYGGEDFVMLLPGATADSMAVVAERLRSSVEALRFYVDGEPLQVSISLGGQTWRSAQLPPNIEFATLL